MHFLSLAISIFVVVFNLNAIVANAIDDFVVLDKSEVDKMGMHQRVKYAASFLEASRGKVPKHRNGKVVCDAQHKFKRCCEQFFLPDDMPIADPACKYPPDDLSLGQQITLGYYINKYIMCYGDGHDNRDCCAKKGVPTDCVSWLVLNANCQDFCHADGQSYEAKAGYRCCEEYKPAIAECNRQSNKMDEDTAAVRYKFCQQNCKPAWPEYCKASRE